ncbi:hypothetical protein PybrP1_002932 [[Pythium] brassicae (nom. inval.)]|nr:hypothetical protein PybrP1_002932 [[Pythium] brassicae (nom. inval.)]
MSEFLEFASALTQRIDAFCAATGVRVDPAGAAALVSCGAVPRHFVRADALERHLRVAHGVKFPAHASHEFFYTNAPSVQRIEQSGSSSTSNAAGDGADADADALVKAADAMTQEDVDETEAQDAPSLLEPLATTVTTPTTQDGDGDNKSSEELTAANAREQVVRAVAALATDAGEFYAAVERWRRIPRAFAVLAWDDDTSNNADGGILADGQCKKAVQGWLIAELSRTVFQDEPLDMDLVEYVVGLLEHPAFCQPDVLVQELREFLGGDASRLVLALWKFLVVDFAMRVVFKTTKKSLAKQIRSREELATAERARVKLQRLREDEEAQLKQKNSRGLQSGSGADSQRDYKRRRPTYRKRGSGAKSVQLVLREVLEKQMLTLSVETGRELVEVDEVASDRRVGVRAVGTDGARLASSSAAEWMHLTDALRPTTTIERQRRRFAPPSTVRRALLSPAERQPLPESRPWPKPALTA